MAVGIIIITFVKASCYIVAVLVAVHIRAYLTRQCTRSIALLALRLPECPVRASVETNPTVLRDYEMTGSPGGFALDNRRTFRGISCLAVSLEKCILLFLNGFARRFYPVVSSARFASHVLLTVLL